MTHQQSLTVALWRVIGMLFSDSDFFRTLQQQRNTAGKQIKYLKLPNFKGSPRCRTGYWWLDSHSLLSCAEAPRDDLSVGTQLRHWAQTDSRPGETGSVQSSLFVWLF